MSQNIILWLSANLSFGFYVSNNSSNKRHPRQNLEGIQYQILSLTEKKGKVVIKNEKF